MCERRDNGNPRVIVDFSSAFSLATPSCDMPPMSGTSDPGCGSHRNRFCDVMIPAARISKGENDGLDFFAFSFVRECVPPARVC